MNIEYSSYQANMARAVFCYHCRCGLASDQLRLLSPLVKTISYEENMMARAVFVVSADEVECVLSREKVASNCRRRYESSAPSYRRSNLEFVFITILDSMLY
jgi:hypothetical protein